MKALVEKKPRTRESYDSDFQIKVAKQVKNIADVTRVAEATGVHKSTVHLWFLTLKALGEEHFKTRDTPRRGGGPVQDLWNVVKEQEKRLTRLERELGVERNEA